MGQYMIENVLLFSFSGTGSTHLISSMLAEHFRNLHANVTEYRIEELKNDRLPDTGGADVIGIGYPVHAFNAPRPVVDFIQRFPASKPGIRVFFFRVSGEPFAFNNAASAMLYRHLRKKGYDIVFERHFLMPYNIVFRYPDALVKQMVLTNRKLTRGMAKSILMETREIKKYALRHRAVSFVFRMLQWPGARLNGRLYRVNKSCTRCMQCVRECPSGNIRLERGRIKFGWRCYMCMRCVMHCPEQAIRIGLLSLWAVRGAYDFAAIAADQKIPAGFIGRDTKGYFRTFRRYYRWAEKKIEDELNHQTKG